MGPIELSLKMRAHEIHSRLRNTKPPENHQMQAIIDNLREQLAKANAKIKRYESNKRSHPIHRIIDLVCQTEKVPRVDLLSERRPMYLCRVRHIAYYLSATRTPCSLPQIGIYFGGRDHTTVLHGRDKIKNLRLRDAVLDAKLNWYENRLAEEFVDKRGA